MTTTPTTKYGIASASWGRASSSAYGDEELNEECSQNEFKLPYFKVCLFATILEDAINHLRILDECNTALKLQRTMSDMTHLLVKKYNVEEQPVRDELDEIDPKRLGCLQYTLNKLHADRAMVANVLKDTYLSLTTTRQYHSLSDSVDQAEERRERLIYLMEVEAKNKLVCRDLARQLRQQRNHITSVTYDKNNALEAVKAALQDVELKAATRSRYVVAWQLARTEQHAQTILDKETPPMVNIDMYKSRIEQEQHVHSEVELLFNIKIQEVMEKVEDWMKKYDTDMEKIDLEIQKIRNKYELTRERRTKLETMLEEHAEHIRDWVRFKEEREAARLYREKMQKSAIMIQAWWRGLLVRNKLGPYKVVLRRKPKGEKGKK